MLIFIIFGTLLRYVNKPKVTIMMKKLLPLSVLIFCSALSFSQNQYLDFKEGLKENQKISTLPDITINQKGTSEIKMNYYFSGSNLISVKNNNTNYQHVRIEGLTNLNQVGAPALPVKNDLIAVPEGSAIKFKIVSSKHFTYKGFNIHPALKPARDTEGAPEPEFEKDEKIYSTNAFFPQEVVELKLTGISRKNKINKLQVTPVQFNPVTGQIRVYTELVVKIIFEGDPKNFQNISQKNSLHFTNMLKRGVLNSKMIPNGINQNSTRSKSGAKNYIIITHEAFSDQAEDLANWKRKLGYGVEILSDDEWTPSKIKSAISLRYNNWTPRPDYFVIIGDHSGMYPVPGEIKPVFDTDEQFATDHYYGCMDGVSDFMPDIAGGRISVSTTTEAQIVIDKIINYEKNPVDNSDFYTNMLSCAQYQDNDNDGYADRRFCHTSENIRDYLQNEQGYTSTRIYYSSTGANISELRYNNGYYSTGQLLPAELRDAGFDWGGNENNITNAINQGKYLVFHRDHGFAGGSGWSHPYYTTTTMNSLSNGELLPVIFSMNCHTGEYQLENCFSEKLLRMENKGAVGVVGAAYYSYSGYNDALSMGMIDAIWSDPGVYADFGYGGTGYNYTIGAGNNIYTMGDVVNQGLFAMLNNWDGNTSNQRYQYELFHYFGDPAMKIWTANPHDNVITADHDSFIHCSDSLFTISNSTSEALVTLVYNDKLIVKDTLDSNGSTEISFDIFEYGEEINLTISKHNYKPYTATISIEGECDYPPMLTTDSILNVSDVHAHVFGTIVNDYGNEITEYGVVCSPLPDPEVGSDSAVHVSSESLTTSGSFEAVIENLMPATTYYAKTYAINSAGINYGEQKIFRTLCAPINIFPYTIGFEEGMLPECWDIDGTEWDFQSGGHNQNPATAHSGNYNAIFYNGAYLSDISSLITQRIDFSDYNSAMLTLWHAQPAWAVEQDELRIYYKNSLNGAWTMLEEYTHDIPDWTKDTIALPELSTHYYLKFEATGNYGFGVLLDDLEISAISSPTYSIDFNVTDINAQPIEGAFVEILGQQLNTDNNGSASFEIYDGEHDFTITHEDYTPYSSTVSVNGAPEQIAVTLNLMTYTVTFNVTLNSSPSNNATIEINETILNTDVNGEATIELSEGTYDYTASLNGYGDIAGSITVNGGEHTENIAFTGIDDFSAMGGEIYPNPTTGNIHIKWPGKCYVTVLNTLGKIITTSEVNQEATLNLNSVPEGIYLIRIKENNKVYTKKIIINR